MSPTKILACLFALLVPASAMAFETVDTIVYPSRGLFPAYPSDVAPRPVEFYVQGGVMHDNNVARLSKSQNASAVLGSSQRSDDITRLGAGVRFDQRVLGRQTLRFEARGDQYWYNKYR